MMRGALETLSPRSPWQPAQFSLNKDQPSAAPLRAWAMFSVAAPRDIVAQATANTKAHTRPNWDTRIRTSDWQRERMPRPNVSLRILESLTEPSIERGRVLHGFETKLKRERSPFV
jgi:hypothetical protein